MPPLSEIIEALPVILSLIVIEGLLSVDNALAIAALASHLPKAQQQLALKLGIVGAYLFRGLAMFFVAVVIKYTWLKIIGAAYLIYLMASNLAPGEDENEEEANAKRKQLSLFLTVCQIELMDLTLSLDNVVAAVALDKRFWVVCTGVFIGILALRFLAGGCIKLIARFPILEKTAFLLIGFVGVILLVEISFELNHVHVHIDSIQKFIGIIIILALTILYAESAVAKRLLTPVVFVGGPVLTFFDKVLGMLFWPIGKLFQLGKHLFLRKPLPVPGTGLE